MSSTGVSNLHLLILTSLVSVFGAQAPALATFEDITLAVVTEGLTDPVAVTHAGDDRLFITELRGQILILQDGQLLAEPFLDLTDRVPITGHGVLSVAFHPDYSTRGYIFVHRAEKGTLDSLVTRFRVSVEDPNRADLESEVVLLRIPKELRRHYGGQVAFGSDGYLYVSTGDNSGFPDGEEPLVIDPECATQSSQSLEGKILRLDVDRNVDEEPYHGVPPDNPFTSGPAGEVWALGLRNPWRFSFDRENGDLWISDVGEGSREEVNRQPASSPGGENYGWKVMEGTSCFGDTAGCGEVPVCNSPALTPPALEYSHANGHCAVTGGVVYRGSLVPSLYGRYLYGDFCSGTLWAAPVNEVPQTTRELPVRLPTVVSFGEDPNGEVYLTARGALYRLVDPTVPAAGVVEFAVTSAELGEDAREGLVSVRRSGEGEGEVRVEVRRSGGDASSEDVPFHSATVTWDAGETGIKTFAVPLVDDRLDEPDETVLLRLDEPAGGAVLGARQTAEIRILDNDEPEPPACLADANHLCLSGGRFRVSVRWQTAGGQNGLGRATILGEDSGSFWFFSANNPEIFVKVLDGCFDPFHTYWVFAAGLTDVMTSLEVLDTSTGEVRRYNRPAGVSYEAVRDTSAFATCP